jgi:hypothetical protein
MIYRLPSHDLRRREPARGQSLVEVALILPILSVLLMGIIEFGFLLYAHVQVANAAREAARAASLYRSTRYATTDVGFSCSGSIKGWSLQNVAEQAVVSRLPLDGNGCLNSSAAIASTSLGRLNPAPVSPDVIQITFSDTQDSVFWPSSQATGNVMPIAGTRAAVTVVYPYHLVVVSNVLPFLANPISIRKAVSFEFAP